jgi:5-methylcytosine-specific restriction endonuclease McrA
MPSKPRTLAGILRSRRHADREYNLTRRDPLVARIHVSARWQAVRAQVLRDEPVCRECASRGVTEPATQVDHVVPLAVSPHVGEKRPISAAGRAPGPATISPVWLTGQARGLSTIRP